MSGFKFVSSCLLVGGAILATAIPAFAADFRLRRAPQSAASPTHASQPGHVTYIRRLVRDANAAAARGDTAGARRLAERAHKIAVMYQSAPGGGPDCTPEATAALAQKYGSPNANDATPSTAAAKTAAPPQRLATAQGQDLDLTSMVDPKFKAQTQNPPRTSTTRETSQTAKPAKLSNKLEPSNNQSRQQVQALPARISRPVAPPKSIVPESARRESVSHEPRPIAARTGDAGRLSRQVAKSSGEPVRTPAPLMAEPIADPEVQSAIGNGADNDWAVELDSEDEAAELPVEEDEAQLPPAPPAEEISRTQSLNSRPGSSIGVWSPDVKAATDDVAPQQAVSLPRFLEPEISPVSRDVDPTGRDRGPQLIETDFRRPVRSNLAQLELQDRKLPRAATPSGPVIRLEEEPAVNWPAAAGRPRIAKVTKAQSLPLGLASPSTASEQVALTIGAALLLAGLVLFGLSFRRV